MENPTSAQAAIDRLLRIMDKLRDPGGCPWDREQTLRTLTPYLLEEAHEVIEAQRGTKVMNHPQLGTLRLHHAQTIPTGQPELRMAIYAPADEATRAALATL